MAQGSCLAQIRNRIPPSNNIMLPPMKKGMKAKAAMTKGALIKALAEKCEVKPKQAGQYLAGLTDAITAEVKKNGAFNLAGLCRIKTRLKPATKAGKREMFGKVCIVKAKPAKTVVKAFPAAALKAAI